MTKIYSTDLKDRKPNKDGAYVTNRVPAPHEDLTATEYAERATLADGRKVIVYYMLPSKQDRLVQAGQDIDWDRYIDRVDIDHGRDGLEPAQYVPGADAVLSIRIPHELDVELSDVADREDRTKASVIRLAIKQYLAKAKK